MGQSQVAIEALVQFVESSPTDAEAWCELSDLYQMHGMSSQAIFCLEEALLIVPNAWNVMTLWPAYPLFKRSTDVVSLRSFTPVWVRLNSWEPVLVRKGQKAATHS